MRDMEGTWGWGSMEHEAGAQNLRGSPGGVASGKVWGLGTLGGGDREVT